MNVKGIVIDPGHGGIDTGAVGNGIIEKNLTLAISKYMYDRFKELGVPVKLTRNDDSELGPNIRPQKVLEQFGNGSDVIVISNHINAGGGEGAEVIYALRNNNKLATNIINELQKAGQIPRKIYQRRLPSDPTKDYYYILRNTPNNQTLIVEYGFLDNAKDATKLKNNYKAYADAVINAVLEYIGYKANNVDTYTVKSGDTLWSIARNYNLTVNELKNLNNLTSNNLSVGQVLKIKNTAEPSIPDIPENNDNNYYIVKKGDTLYSIAQINNLTVDELKTLNNLNSNALSIGQKLIVNKSIPYNTYIVQRGDTLYSIAKQFNLNIEDLKNINNLTDNILSIGQELIIPSNSSIKPTYQTYTIQKGDTLYNLAKKFNTDVTTIKQLNNLTNNILSIGQVLSIPN